ncbi:hypothetical protein [Hellea balneolensis]|uniref:hypothetical protein n=1 Tax=Hellea balneolensis TaxID=287478 RepID=UPI00042564E2|nr:hypothetical protein [Hellea balneolensis]
MTKEQILADLDYASQLAKDGANTPLLGGPIGLMWGILLTLILGYQYLILAQKIDIPPQTLAIAWIAYGVIGGIGSTVLGRRIDRMPGANSVNNRVETYVWIMFVGAIITVVIGSVLNMTLGQGNQTVWNTVLVFAFAGQGMAYGIVAKLAKEKILHMASFASFVFSAVVFMLIHDPVIYLIGSIGAAITIIMPNLILGAQAKSAAAAHG